MSVSEFSSEHILIQTILEENKEIIKKFLIKNKVRELELTGGIKYDSKIYLRSETDHGYVYNYYVQMRNKYIDFFDFSLKSCIQLEIPYFKYPWFFIRDVFDFLVEVIKEI